MYLECQKQEHTKRKREREGRKGDRKEGKQRYFPICLKLKTRQEPSETRKKQGRNVLWCLQKKHGLIDTFISDFQLPEL